MIWTLEIHVCRKTSLVKLFWLVSQRVQINIIFTDCLCIAFILQYKKSKTTVQFSEKNRKRVVLICVNYGQFRSSLKWTDRHIYIEVQMRQPTTDFK